MRPGPSEIIKPFVASTLLWLSFLLPTCTQDTGERAWQEDIDFLAETYPQKHRDFEKITDPVQFRKDLEEISDRVPGLKEHEIILELQRVFARLGVSHSGILFYYSSLFRMVPVQLELFDDGLFLTRLPSGKVAGPDHRITAINGHPLDTVMLKLSAYISFENDYWRDFLLPRLLVMPGVLNHAGVGTGSQEIAYRLQNGEQIESTSNAQLGEMAFMSRLSRHPWREMKNKYYWYGIPGDSLLYVQYNKCQDDPDLSFHAFTEMIRASLEEQPVSRLVLDVRLNEGGNSNVLHPLTEALKAYSQLDIYVVMSRETFSSGTFAVRDFKRDLGATLIGEPTGGAPVSYGEVKSIELPNTGVRINYCVKHFTLTDSELPYFEPDIHIPYVSSDYFAGRDPVLEYLGIHKPLQ